MPCLNIFGQNVGINDDGTTPNSSAILDVKSTTRGILLPRVSLTGTASAAPVTTPATGLVVYNIATVTDVTPGYYFWNGSSWTRFSSGVPVPDNVYVISDKGDFKTIGEAIVFLTSNMAGPSTIQLGCSSYSITATQTINLPYPLTIEGTSAGVSTINATTGSSPVFICSTECYFKMLKITGAVSSDCIQLTGNGVYHEIKDCSFSGFNRAVAMTGNADLWLFENNFSNATGAGVEINAPGSIRLRSSENHFNNCTLGINLASGKTATISIINSTFNNSPGQTGIVYVPALFSIFSSIFISNNTWNNTGSFITGFDFTRSDGRDARAFIENNSGIESKSAHCRINVIHNNTPIRITASGTFYRAAWTNTSSETCKWGIGTTAPVNGNRITYQPVDSRAVMITITGNIAVNGNNRTVGFGFCRNGVNSTRFGEQTLNAATSGLLYPFSTVTSISDVAANDYIEFYVTSSVNGDAVTVSDVNMVVKSQ